MTRPGDHPLPLGEVLRGLARRVRKVDLTVMEEILALWPTLLAPSVVQQCRPEFVKNQVLVVSVPSGAYAQHVMWESETILRGLAGLGDRAPQSIKTIQKP